MFPEKVHGLIQFSFFTLMNKEEQPIEALLQEQFPDIYEAEARKVLLENGRLMEVKAGELMMDIGQYIKFIPLVVKGLLKIMREDKDGHELLLYYIHPGETCAMSLTCCQGEARSNVRAVAEEDTLAVAVPVRLLDEWTTEYRSLKSFVLLSYQRRFDELLKTIDGIAFQHLDDRLISALEARGRNKVLEVTHQELATELNSSREVISRLLKQLEHQGRVRMGRGKLEWLG